MKTIADYRTRLRGWKRTEKETPKKLETAEKVELEKGDVLAILLAGLVNFILPLMLMCSVICLIAYLVFAAF